MLTETPGIERKYEAPPSPVLPDLSGLPRVAAHALGGEQRLEAVYHDTADLDLARAGITLRHRSGGEDEGWQLTLPRGFGTGRDLRRPPGPAVPDEFTALLTARLRGRPLRPVARLLTTRRRWDLAGSDGASLGNVALDAVTAETFAPTPGLTRWNEVELALLDGRGAGRALLKAVDRKLRGEGLRRATHASKLELAMGTRWISAGDAARRVTRPKRSQGRKAVRARARRLRAGEVVTVFLRRQFEELTACDLHVRRDDPDAVHRMRVAARRIRAALQAFDTLFVQRERESLTTQLRWLGTVLGRARDEEVLCDRITARIDGLPVESVLGPVRARVVGHYAPRQASARALVLEALTSERYLRLLTDLDAFTAHPPLTARGSEPAGDVLPKLVARAERRVRKRMEAARRKGRASSDPAGGPEYDAALHEVRKAAKRARYAAEAAEGVMGKPARKTAKRYERLQTVLGEQHDAVNAASALRQLAIRAHGEGENTFTYGLLHEHETALAESARHRARGLVAKGSAKGS